MTWAELKDKHWGETCVLMACGPSLTQIDAALYDLYPTIGVNRSYLLKEPDYFCMVEPNGLRYCMEAIKKLSSVKFVHYPFADEAKALPLYSVQQVVFSLEPNRGVYEGYTVTYVALQLAYYLGFQTVLLAGLDHRYTKEAGGNHFSAEYLRDGMPWYAPDQAKVEEAYKLAEHVFSVNSREIINISPGSECTIFKKADYGVYLYR
jgi:hypothetical protein